MKKGIGNELKNNYEKQKLVHDLNNLFNSNEISISKNANTEVKHFKDEGHKGRQKKALIKKIKRSKKLIIKIPKKLPSKKSKTNKKLKSKNSYNNYVKNNKKQMNINFKEYYTNGGEMNTLPESPEKNARFQIEKFIKNNLDNRQIVEKESIKKDIDINANININEGDNNIASLEKERAFKIGRDDFNIIQSENKNEFICGNKEHSIIKKINFNESSINLNKIRKKNSFSSQKSGKDNITRAKKSNDKSKKEESSLPKFNGFEIISENSISESDKLPANDKENNFNPFEKNYHNEINIDDIDNLIPRNPNDSNENINLGLIEDINCNFKNRKNKY